MTTVAYAVPSVQRIGCRISCEAVQAPGSAAISCRVAVSADRRRAAPPRRARARGAYRIPLVGSATHEKNPAPCASEIQIRLLGFLISCASNLLCKRTVAEVITRALFCKFRTSDSERVPHNGCWPRALASLRCRPPHAPPA